MKIAISAYSFNALIQQGKETQFSCIALAKKLGFEAIEFITLAPHDGSNKKDYAQKLRDEATRQEIEISCYSVGANLLSGNLQEELEKIKEELAIAEILQAPYFRHDLGFSLPSDQVGRKKGVQGQLVNLVTACREITEAAAKKNIHTLVENHGQIFQDPDWLEKVITEVQHPNFGLLMDLGNFICGDVDPILACGQLLPLADYIHAKDFHLKKGNEDYPGEPFGKTRSRNFYRGAIIGHGNIPLKQCLTMIKDSHYTGYLAIEFEGMEDPITGVRLGYENLKKMIEEQ